MIYDDSGDLWNLILYSGLFAFLLVVTVIEVIKYKLNKRKKVTGCHEMLYKTKFNLNDKVNNFEIGYHLFKDDEKEKWAIVCDNPRKCEIYKKNSLEDYVLTLNGECIPRSSMSNLITEIELKSVSNITLDIFVKGGIKYRIVFLNHEVKKESSAFELHYKQACDFCDMLDKILGV